MLTGETVPGNLKQGEISVKNGK